MKQENFIVCRGSKVDFATPNHTRILYALELAHAELATVDPADLMRLRSGLAGFLVYDPDEAREGVWQSVGAYVGHGPRACTVEEFRSLQDDARRLLTHVAGRVKPGRPLGPPVEVEEKMVLRMERLDDGAAIVRVHTSARAMFVARLVGALAAHPDAITTCADPKCRRVFVAVGKTMYCSDRHQRRHYEQTRRDTIREEEQRRLKGPARKAAETDDWTTEYRKDR
jgi:hypothetical protein